MKLILFFVIIFSPLSNVAQPKEVKKIFQLILDTVIIERTRPFMVSPISRKIWINDSTVQYKLDLLCNFFKREIYEGFSSDCNVYIHNQKLCVTDFLQPKNNILFSKINLNSKTTLNCLSDNFYLYELTVPIFSKDEKSCIVELRETEEIIGYYLIKKKGKWKINRKIYGISYN